MKTWIACALVAASTTLCLAQTDGNSGNGAGNSHPATLNKAKARNHSRNPNAGTSPDAGGTGNTPDNGNDGGAAGTRGRGGAGERPGGDGSNRNLGGSSSSQQDPHGLGSAGQTGAGNSNSGQGGAGSTPQP